MSTGGSVEREVKEERRKHMTDVERLCIWHAEDRLTDRSIGWKLSSSRERLLYVLYKHIYIYISVCVYVLVYVHK